MGHAYRHQLPTYCFTPGCKAIIYGPRYFCRVCWGYCPAAEQQNLFAVWDNFRRSHLTGASPAVIEMRRAALELAVRSAAGAILTRGG